MSSFQGQRNDLLSVDKEKLFWSKVDIREPDKCWNYNEGKSSDGYGIFDHEYTHRFAWKSFHKTKIPFEKLILHKCDNRACCNPKHLYCGTHQDNVNDMFSRCRSNPQLKVFGLVKLYAKDIQAIRKLKGKYKHSQRKVAEMFGVGHSLICCIWNSDKYPCKEGYYV